MVAQVPRQPPTPRIAKDRLGERVVHHRVETVAGEPRIGALPNFSNRIRLRIDRAYARAELLPKTLIINLFWYVESPAVGAETNPELGRLQQVLAGLCIANVDLWECRKLPPRLVADGGLKVARDPTACTAALLHVPIDRLWIGDQWTVAAQEGLVGIEPINVG